MWPDISGAALLRRLIRCCSTDGKAPDPSHFSSFLTFPNPASSATVDAPKKEKKRRRSDEEQERLAAYELGACFDKHDDAGIVSTSLTRPYCADRAIAGSAVAPVS